MNHGRAPTRMEGMISLKVGNLSYRSTTNDVRRVFCRYGKLGDVYIPKDKNSRLNRGFAFVRLLSRAVIPLVTARHVRYARGPRVLPPFAILSPTRTDGLVTPSSRESDNCFASVREREARREKRNKKYRQFL